MIQHRPRAQLGRTEAKGLRSEHHFCFASYQDPARMDWGQLRLLSRHVLAGGASYGPLHHFNMDILLLPLDGGLSLRIEESGSHEIDPGELLYVSAGSGIRYTIANRDERPATYLELWLFTRSRAEIRAATSHLSGHARETIASGAAGEAKVQLNSHAKVSLVRVATGATVAIADCANAYGLVIDGAARCGDIDLAVGDAVAVQGGDAAIVTTKPSRILLIETD